MNLRPSREPARTGSVAVSGTGGVGIAGDNHGSIDVTVSTTVIRPPEVTWPACVGIVPALASAHLERPEFAGVADSTVRGTRVLTGEGGVGKSQLAAWVAHQALDRQAADLVVWTPAGSTDQIVTAFAHAAARVGIPEARGQDRASDARAFLQWLQTTDRTWLIILDDIIEPGHVTGWWPPDRSAGRTLATTRRRDAALTGSGRLRWDVGVFAAEQSQRYLTDRLTAAGLPHLVDDHAQDLAGALGQLPLALAHAAAYLINQEEPCRAYLRRFTGGSERLTDLMPGDSDPDEYGNPVAVTLLLAREAAERAQPAGLVRPALALAAVLDPAGHPDALWRTEPAIAFLGHHRDQPGRPPATAAEVDKVLRVLHRFGLLTHHRQDGPRAVRMHALTARAVRESRHLFRQPQATLHAAADALLALWPDRDHATDGSSDALRSNVTALIAHPGGDLWTPGVHPIVWKAGTSLYHAGLHAMGAGYWDRCLGTAERVLGPRHADTISVRAGLARAYRHSGRIAEAITIDESVLTDRLQVLGADHPETLAARHNLAGDHRALGQYDQAQQLYEQVLTERQRVLGAEHADTLWSQSHLAWVHAKAGRHAQALLLDTEVAASRERLLGADHPDTLWSSHNIAADLRGLRHHEEALRVDLKVAADRERILGRRHPDTLASLNNVAWNYSNLGRHEQALALHVQLADDRGAILGPDHPDTLWSRAAIAVDLADLGRYDEARVLHEQVSRDRHRVIGPDHPNTLWSDHHLAGEYRRLGRFTDALHLDLRVATTRRRLLGADHRDTLRSENNLAWDYAKLGRHAEARPLKRRVAACLERALGPDHPSTLSARHHAIFAHRVLGEFDEALRLDQQVLAARERVLGPDHPDTLSSRHNIAWNHAALGHYEVALRLDRQVLADRIRILGSDHLDTSWSRSALAFDLRGLGRYAEALELTRRVAADRARVLGETHYDTLWAKHNLAWDYAKHGRFLAALRLDQQVMAARTDLIGADHMETLWSRAAVARDYHGLGRHQVALSMMQGVAADRERVLGADHPETVHTRRTVREWQSELDR